MGYTLATTTLWRSSTNAEFQAWGKQLSDAIANSGIIRESDANVGTQINWATVEKPNTTNQSRGYEIYRLADALQNTAPIYFKLEYGSSAWGTDRPNLWITVGSGANASGNVTGNTSSRYEIPQAVIPAATNTNSYFSGSTSRFTALIATETGYHWGIGIERTVDVYADLTANGLNMIGMTSTLSGVQQALWTPEKGNVAPWSQRVATLTPTTTGLFANCMSHHHAFYRIYPFDAGVMYPPMTMFVVGFASSFNARDIINVPVNGVNTPYRVIGNSAISYVSMRSSQGKTLLFQRWD